MKNFVVFVGFLFGVSVFAMDVPCLSTTEQNTSDEISLKALVESKTTYVQFQESFLFKAGQDTVRILGRTEFLGKPVYVIDFVLPTKRKLSKRIHHVSPTVLSIYSDQARTARGTFHVLRRDRSGSYRPYTRFQDMTPYWFENEFGKTFRICTQLP